MVDNDKLLAGCQAVDEYRAAHSKIHSIPWHEGVAGEHEVIIQKLLSDLRAEGFNSLRDYDVAMQQYSSDPDTILRAEKLRIRVLLLSGGASSEIEQQFYAQHRLMLDGPWDIALATSRKGALVSISPQAPAEEQPDLEECQKRNIRVIRRRVQGTGVLLYNPRSAVLGIREKASAFINNNLMQRLSQLCIKEVCIGLGLSAESITFGAHEFIDLNINGKTFCVVRAVTEEGWFISRLLCNLEFDNELAEAVLRRKEGATPITSVSAELGKPVPENTFRTLILESMCRRFNVEVAETDGMGELERWLRSRG